jgi:hypothetical protein
MEPAAPGRVGRSIAAIVAGIVVGVALTLATDALLHQVGFYPPLGQTTGDGPLLVATLYRIVFAILGAYLIARLAPNRPMLHALISGALGVALSTAGAIATWNHVPSLGPHWYPLALIVTALPCAWLGARLYLMRSKREHAASKLENSA